jgi:crotonobetaine/carnitine-CoA ligase
VATWARKEPSRPFLRQVEGGELSYGEAHDDALRWAAAIGTLGVEVGDLVVVMRRPRMEGIALWLGLAWLGAVETSINTDYRGDMLAYVLANAGARVVVVDAEFLSRFEEIADRLPPDLVVVVTRGGGADVALSGAVLVDGDVLIAESRPTEPSFVPEPWSIASVIYTSGTTGPSKGVRVPWAQIHATAEGTFPSKDLRDDEVFYSPFTLFHMSGKLPPAVMAACGGSVVMREQLTLTGFWDDIRAFGATTTIFSKVATDMLMAEPPSDRDRDLPLRQVVMGPVAPDHAEFTARFGVRVGTAFNMTEISVPLHSWDIGDPASCGRLREGFPGYECRLVDENDMEVATGELGELVVRTSEPWTLNAGYHGYPEKTAEAWRNGWFHTGDAFRRDDNGNYYFVDRFKDALRRRGENISSFEVELGVCAHPEVAECAVVAAPGGDSGDEIKAVVVLVPGSTLEPEQLLEFLSPRMPRFMLPRYVQFVSELPKTPTLKVRKAELRADALNASTWDRLQNKPPVTSTS